MGMANIADRSGWRFKGDDVDGRSPSSADGVLTMPLLQDANNRPAFLLDQLAGPAEERRAALVVLGSVLLFLAIVPWASVKLAELPIFIPIYEAVLVIIDLITAVLLFAQYRILKARALLVLGCGYLFTVVMVVAHALSYPAVFAPTGLLGGGAQTTAWIYMFWHGGFPLFVLGYVIFKRPEAPRRSPAWTWPLATLLLCGLLIGLATKGESLLPAIMIGSRYSPAMQITVGAVWLCCVLALIFLWRQRPRTTLDLWLMVVCIAWLFDIALSALLNTQRYDLGFYAGRIFGLLACSLVMLELLLENSFLYVRLFEAYEADRRLNDALATARDEAQAANAAKSLFLASMSHEIRTPMNAVIGLTNLVLETPLNDKQRDYLGKVKSSSKALLMLLNDILDYSKIEAGKVTIEEEEFSLDEIVENVGDLFATKVEEAGLDLIYEIDERIPRRLVGDPLRLTQILNNLVGNAIKFTPKGEIVILAEALSVDPGGVQLRLSVRDTGIGMTEEQMGRLFQVFSQADSSITRRYGGTGLGLAICKQLVELMGGNIGVTSSPGQGSCFSFTGQFRRAAPGIKRGDLHRIRGMRTLIVDAQPTERQILQKVLQSWRFQVNVASFADQALHRLSHVDRTLPYELLILDRRCVDVAFLQAARQIMMTRCGKVPAALFLCSPHQREQVEAEVSDLRETGVLVKPATPSRIFDAITQLQHGDLTEPIVIGSKTLSLAESLMPLRGSRVLLVEDNPSNQQVTCAFLSMARLDFEVANNGVEAVDWIKSSNFDAVLMDVHMPEMNGLMATRLIRSLPGRAALPIIAMTAGAMEQDIQDSLAAGMDAHISKPIDPRELAASLLKWIVLKAQDRHAGRIN